MFKQFLYQLQIKLMLVTSPASFFHKINTLDWYAKTLHEWVDSIPLSHSDKILEVGSATGTLTAYLTKSGYLATGVDTAKSMIKMAEKQNPDIEFTLGNITDLPFPDERFNAVIAASVINIVADKEKAIKEMVRVCKKGGIISILVPSAEFNNKDFDLLKDTLTLSGFSQEALNAWHKLAPKMEADNINHLLKEAGLITKTPKVYLKGMVISILGIKQ